MPEGPEGRRLACERLIQAGLAELYQAQGKTAIRSVPVTAASKVEASPPEPAGEE